MKRSIKTLIMVMSVLLFMGFFITVPARSINSSGFIRNLNAPILGVTPSTVILIWDDIFAEDLSGENYSVNTRSYDIYQDSVKIATTNRHNFTVKGLSPDHSYTFSVCFKRIWP